MNKEMNGKVFSGFAFVLDREFVQEDKLIKIVSLMEIKLDATYLKLTVLPLESSTIKNPQLVQTNPAFRIRHFNLLEMNAGVELPSD